MVVGGGADLYYSPAQREDELYQQLNRQRIKSIPNSHIKYIFLYIIIVHTSQCQDLDSLAENTNTPLSEPSFPFLLYI